MLDIDKLLNPNKTFLEYQDYLIDLIASSYHKQFKDTVATRIKESLYFFDSLPDITYQTIKNNNSNLKKLIQYFFINMNYEMSKLIIANIEKDNHYYLLKQFLDIDNNFFKNNKEVILNLDFRVFSKKVNKLLLDKTLDETVKDKIKEKQQDCRYVYEFRAKESHLSKQQASEFLLNNMGENSEYVFMHEHVER